jgi:peptidoglycan/xylan/chitin deacetylase (PgdA/CDA1 family)
MIFRTKFLRATLPATYPVLRFGHVLGRAFRVARAGGRLRVLMYHNIAPGEESRFAEQMRWLSQRWTFVSPVSFEAMIDGDEPVVRDSLLLTFDDGFASNRAVAERILSPMGIQALFFVVSEFVDLYDSVEARRFVADRFFPGLSTENVPAQLTNMTWADLYALLEQGHHLGAHTATHARLAETTPVEEIEKEIVVSADTLEKRLGLRIKHFAWPFGDLGSFSRQAFSIAARRFQYIHSGLRGNNSYNVSQFAIRRDAISVGDSHPMIGALLEGGADFRYRKHASILDGWTMEA